jgi:Uri superfamily endonuclease
MRGNYLLLFELPGQVQIKVGRLGMSEFSPGLYVYTGSAQNGLESRLGRHFASEKKMHWHIDYLLGHADLIGAFLLVGKDRECELNRMLGQVPGCQPVCEGFGSSDCNCATHLHLISEESLPLILNELHWMI